MGIKSSTIRHVALWFAGTFFFSAIVLGSFAEPLLTQTFEDHGLFKKSEPLVWSMIIDLLWFINSWWLYVIVALFVGFLVGVWIDAFLRKNEEPSSSKTEPPPETMVRVERDQSAPYQWHHTAKKNIYLFFQIWNPKPSVFIKEYVGPFPTYNINIPELFPAEPDIKITPEQLDTFFIVFDKPISYRRIRIESFGHMFPKHDTYAFTERTVILYLREQIPSEMTTFDLIFEVINPPS